MALETDRWDGFLGLVEDISSYHFEKSRFYREKASWLEEAFRYVVRDIRGYFQDKSQSLTEKFIGKPYPANWTPFGNAPVLLPSEPDTVKIYVNRCESYRWKRGRWMGWRYYDADERFVGQIIRETERILRQLTRISVSTESDRRFVHGDRRYNPKKCGNLLSRMGSHGSIQAA